MKKLLLFLLLLPFIGLTQVQIGQDIAGEATNDSCGYGVSIAADGSIIAVSSPGSTSATGIVRIFENINNTWTQLGQSILGEAASDRSGRSISLSGNGTIIAIGAHGNDVNGQSTGHVRVYQYDSTNNIWVQLGQDIDGEAIEHQSGFRTSLSSDGSILAVSDHTTDSSGADGKGKIYQYDTTNNVWTQMGSNFVGLGPGRNQINIVLSGDGSKAFVGDAYNTGYLDYETNGDIRVYEYDTINNVWIQIGQTISLGFPENNNIGDNIHASYDGSMLVTTHFFLPQGGSPNQISRSAKVYKNINGTWTPYGQEIEDAMYSYLSGDGSVLVTTHSGTHTYSPGKARIFKDVAGTWIQAGQTINGEASSDRLGVGTRGAFISSDGLTFIIGTSGGDTYGNNAGYARVYDLTTILSTENFELDNISIYPNPTKDFINIELPSSIELRAITIYDLVGKKLESTKNTIVNLSNYKAGLYILEIETNKGKSSRKIIKE